MIQAGTDMHILAGTVTHQVLVIVDLLSRLCDMTELMAQGLIRQNSHPAIHRPVPCGASRAV